jgi:hypothetical protein
MKPKRVGKHMSSLDMTIPESGDFFEDLSPFAAWNQGTVRYTRHCYAFVCNALLPDTSRLSPGKYELIIPHPGETGGRASEKNYDLIAEPQHSCWFPISS